MTANASPKAAGTEERHSLTKILGIWFAAAAVLAEETVRSGICQLAQATQRGH
jgi:hypothetical protein